MDETLSNQPTITVEIWSDVVCPWCAIGKARFEKAIADFPRADEVEMSWRSFELDRGAPTQTSGSYASLLAAKYATSVDQANGMIDRMTEQAAEEGLDFDFSIARPGNTFDAHRVVHLGAANGLGHQVKSRFLTGYLSEGAAIGDHDVLIDLAVDAGLDRADVSRTLDSDAYAADVRADEAQAIEYGISGVPFFVLDRKVGISGAQPPAVLRQALEQVLPSPEPMSMVGAGPDGDSCGIDGC